MIIRPLLISCAFWVLLTATIMRANPTVSSPSTPEKLPLQPGEAPVKGGTWDTNQTFQSLSQEFGLETLRQIIIPRLKWKPFPRLQDRDAWKALPRVEQKQLMELGEHTLAKSWPQLPATLYLEYARNGNRSRFEKEFFERRRQLQALVFAECVENRGRFLDAAANALWAICEESSWCLPAHVGGQKVGVGLPDTTEPIVDLFAAETAVSVSWTLYLLGPELDKVSRQIRLRAQSELAQRILTPVLIRNNFGWMALNVASPAHRPNNWTPWIAASVLTAALTSETDEDRRLQIVHKMLQSLDGFLKFHPADGGCDEGPGYWSRAGGSLLDCLDLLHSASNGKLDVFERPLIQEIGRFIIRAHIAGDYFVPIGDCAARMVPDHDLVFRYGKRIHDPHLKAFGSDGASAALMLGDGYSFGRMIYAIFDFPEILAQPAQAVPLLREVWLPSDDMQLMAARSQAGSSNGLYVAAWGAHNAQSHNHNDVGNFLVFADGQPVFIDVGAPTYTAQTFSSRRYQIWAFQSAFHNLPTINGVMQSAGRAFAAKSVLCRTNDAFAELEMDIANAYPPTAQANQWLRTVRLNRGQFIEITDAFELKAIVGPIIENLVTPMAVEVNAPGKILLRPQNSPKSSSNVVALAYDPAQWSPEIEPIKLEDDRLVKSWGPNLRRIMFKAQKPTVKGTWQIRITLQQ